MTSDGFQVCGRRWRVQTFWFRLHEANGSVYGGRCYLPIIMIRTLMGTITSNLSPNKDNYTFTSIVSDEDRLSSCARNILSLFQIRSLSRQLTQCYSNEILFSERSVTRKFIRMDSRVFLFVSFSSKFIFF